MHEIHLLRAFKPQAICFGSDSAMKDGRWLVENGVHSTWFRHRNLLVTVLFTPNPEWGCMELLFKTALLTKTRAMASLLRDPDLPEDANRGTEIFRAVVHVALSHIHHFDHIGFNGAHPALDCIYGRLAQLAYVRTLLSQYGFVVHKNGRDMFLHRQGSGRLRVCEPIPANKLQIGKWYVGRGNYGNVAYWDGQHFLMITEKCFEMRLKKTCYYDEVLGGFQPFRIVDEGRTLDIRRKLGFDTQGETT